MFHQHFVGYAWLFAVLWPKKSICFLTSVRKSSGNGLVTDSQVSKNVPEHFGTSQSKATKPQELETDRIGLRACLSAFLASDFSTRDP